MDNQTFHSLATSVINSLQPYLPLIASKAAERVGEEIPDTVKNLWETIHRYFTQKPSARESLEDFSKSPNDADLQAAFRVQLKKLIEEDDGFAKIIQDLAEKAKYSSSQSGVGNISIQGNSNILTQHQSGGITANNVVINNISTNPTPMLKIKQIFINQFREGKYHSRFELSLISPYPVGNLYVGVRAPEIEEMEVAPMRSTGFITGLEDNRDGYAFTNLPNAYGDYSLIIISEKPEKFVIEYNIE